MFSFLDKTEITALAFTCKKFSKNLENKILKFKDFVTLAAELGQLELIKWAYSEYKILFSIKVWNEFLSFAALKGKLTVFEWFDSLNFAANVTIDFQEMFDKAVQSESLALLKCEHF